MHERRRDALGVIVIFAIGSAPVWIVLVAFLLEGRFW